MRELLELSLTDFLLSLEIVSSFRIWLDSTLLSMWVTGSPYLWPALESLHFMGLSLLIGTVGLFDLRLLGFARNLKPATLHRLIPFGVLGYGMNVITGSLFFIAEPDQYMYNAAFQFKMIFMFFTGINVLIFYRTTYRDVDGVEAGGQAPRIARVIGGVSLVLWLAIITCGRLITFYRPLGIF